MRSIVRTMLAAAAGASLVASGTTAVLWTDPALAGGELATSTDLDAPERAGLVPSAADRAPAAQMPAAPVPAPQIPAASIPAAETDLPESAPSSVAPVEESTPRPRTQPDRVAAPGRAAAPAPATQPSAPAPTGADDQAAEPADDGRDDEDDRSDDEDGSPSLLGGLTERVGVSCAGLLVRICD